MADLIPDLAPLVAIAKQIVGKPCGVEFMPASGWGAAELHVYTDTVRLIARLNDWPAHDLPELVRRLAAVLR